MRSRHVAGLALAVAAALALAGCTGTATKVTPSVPTTRPSSSASTALGSLLPVYPSKLTKANAESITVANADAIQALVATSAIVFVDKHQQLIAATKSDGATYGVLRTINVTPTLDPIEQAEAMEKLLIAAGWTERTSTTDTGKYVAALTSTSTGQDAWFLLLGGDSTSKKQPVVTVQLASPDLPTG